ncbi:MAG: hypothetical protein ACTSRS_23135 [Candidatus Helarchaeota archaeon]
MYSHRIHSVAELTNARSNCHFESRLGGMRNLEKKILSCPGGIRNGDVKLNMITKISTDYPNRVALQYTD